MEAMREKQKFNEWLETLSKCPTCSARRSEWMIEYEDAKIHDIYCTRCGGVWSDDGGEEDTWRSDNRIPW